MSGFQGPMAPPQGGMPQMGGQQQLPPQVMQMLMQRMQQQKAMGGMPGGGGPMPQQAPPQMAPPGGMQGGMPGAPPPRPPMMAPPGGGQAPMAPPGGSGGAAGGPPPTGPAPMGQGAPPQPGQQHMTPAEMAAKGRFGDQIVGHLTPGEVQVPPQVQTPQLMHMLQQAFAKAGVSPAQFTAGSPDSSHNPATGAPEYSLLAALLPILGGAAGSFIPGLGTGIGAALGGAAGGAAGGLVDHTGAAGTALSALGGGLGGLVGGGGVGGSGAAASVPEDVDIAGNTIPGAANAASSAASSTPFGGNSSYMNALRPGLGAGLGSAVGGMLAPQPSASSALPPGFNNPMPALNKNFNSLLGNGQSSTPSFAGYNPYSAATGGGAYNVYSPAGNGS